MSQLSGATTASFTITLKHPTKEAIDVEYYTRDGTAKAGIDYEATQGTVRFRAGETAKNVPVLVYGATEIRPDKSFYLLLRPPVNAVVTQEYVEVVIAVLDDDGVLSTQLVIPRGPRGPRGEPGLSAYELAILEGYDGTLDDWLEEIADAARQREKAEQAVKDAEAERKGAEKAKDETNQIKSETGVIKTETGGIRDEVKNWLDNLKGPNAGEEIGVTDPSTGEETNLNQYIINNIAPGIILDHGTTSWAGIKTHENDFETDNTDRFAELLNDKRFITVDSGVNLSNRIYIPTANTVVRGAGPWHFIRPIHDRMAYMVMLNTSAPGIKFQNLRFTNPRLYKGHEKFNASDRQQRQGAIDFATDFCSVESCRFENQLNAVISNQLKAAHGSRVVNSFFIDCLGTGAGPDPANPYINSNGGEDRGDAVTLWGSGGVIANNYANCKPGQDARVAFHFEKTGTDPVNPREFDRMGNVMANNSVYGPFRRHYAFENIQHSISIGNTSLGGATWWSEAYIQCRNIKVANTIRFTRKSTDRSGASWNPVHAGIALINHNHDVHISSSVYMDKESSGAGLAISTRIAEHHFVFDGQLINDGNPGNTAISLLGSNSSFNGVKAWGFSRQVSYYQASGSNMVLKFNNCDMEGNGTGSGLIATGGPASGGIIISGGCWTGNGESALSPTNLKYFHMHSVSIDATPQNAGNDAYAVNAWNVSSYAITGCSSYGNKNLIIRHKGQNNLAMPDIPWTIENNNGIRCGFTHTGDQLKNIASCLNTLGKQPGKIVMVGTNAWMALGPSVNSAWRSLANGEIITPIAEKVMP